MNNTIPNQINCLPNIDMELFGLTINANRMVGAIVNIST